jgi:hypothetical protein
MKTNTAKPSETATRGLHAGPPSFTKERRQVPATSIILTASSALAAVILCGCQVLTYRSAQGERLTRASIGGTTAVSSLSVEMSTNGVRRVELKGYQNDGAQALGTVTEAAVRAALTAK